MNLGAGMQFPFGADNKFRETRSFSWNELKSPVGTWVCSASINPAIFCNDYNSFICWALI
jgi:hypothetical protein